MARGESGRLVEKEELSEAAWLEQRVSVPAPELQAAGDPAPAVEAPADAALLIVQTATVPIYQAAARIRDQLAEWRDPILQRHLDINLAADSGSYVAAPTRSEASGSFPIAYARRAASWSPSHAARSSLSSGCASQSTTNDTAYELFSRNSIRVVAIDRDSLIPVTELFSRALVQTCLKANRWDSGPSLVGCLEKAQELAVEDVGTLEVGQMSDLRQ